MKYWLAGISGAAVVALGFLAPTLGTNANKLDCTKSPFCRGDVSVAAPKGKHQNSTITAEVVIDVDEPLPTGITLPQKGGAITFIRKSSPNTADAGVSIAGTDGKVQPLMSEVSSPDTAPQNYDMIGQYTAGRSGKGELVVSHTVRYPGALPYQEHVKITVK